MTDQTDLIRTIGKLPKKQRDKFLEICFGGESWVHPKTAEKLIRLGLIVAFKDTLPGRFPVEITRYDVASIPVHMAACEWASRHCEEENRNA